MGHEVALSRRFAVDFFNRHDTSVCAEIMVDDYRLLIGRHLIRGRNEQYVPAMQKQFHQFGDLGITVHSLIAAPGRVALHFSEHGTSGGPEGNGAAWSGIAVYATDGDRFVRCSAQEDYYARRRQLKTGRADALPAAAVEPWDTPVVAADMAAEAIVREWLATADATGGTTVRFDDEYLDIAEPLRFEADGVEVLELFSSGSAIAYHAVHSGHYRGGLDGVASSSTRVELPSAGIVRVENGSIVSGHAIRDRLALQRWLRS